LIAAFVADCSVVVASCFDDERTPAVIEVLRLAQTTTVLVPPHWPVEVANVLLVAERKGRLRPENMRDLLDAIRGWSTEIDAGCHDQVFAATSRLARSHRLTAYDAAYLELALRRAMPLASLDQDLREAAKREGVSLLGM